MTRNFLKKFMHYNPKLKKLSWFCVYTQHHQLEELLRLPIDCYCVADQTSSDRAAPDRNLCGMSSIVGDDGWSTITR